MQLSSRAFLETPANEQPHLKLSWLAGATDGLIALTGGPGGPLDAAIAAGQVDLAAARCAALLRLFGDRTYVELQRHGTAAERSTEAALIDLAYTQSLPLVATNEPFFARREDYEAHDALICIAEGRVIAQTDRRQLTAEHYFKSRAEMAALFADIPEALASTVEIAERCAFRPQIHEPILPRFSVGDRDAPVDEAAELRARAEAGLQRRIAAHGLAPGHSLDEYHERLANRASRHRDHEVSRLFPDRVRLHPMGEGAGHPGRPGPRFGRGLARRLRAHHHRPRPDPVRICCSSASSTSSAYRCRTSTSISARTAATR